MLRTTLLASVFSILFSAAALADKAHTDHESSSKGEVCAGYGPQTPRDIDSKFGQNKTKFNLTSSTENMNLCNIHFHKNAEHKAAAFNILADNDPTKGYQCGISKTLSKAELAPTKTDICGGLKPGDTVEVHWVHTSCEVAPGPTLGACSSAACANPSLRVETQVFTLVNDKNALNFADFDYQGQQQGGFHTANLPTGTGESVQFLGSTTGPSYNEAKCSPLQVDWAVRPQCAKLDINTLGQWCKGNAFDEDHAHGVRKLVVNPNLLSEIN